MPNTAGGPLGGLLRDPALWEKLLNSFSTIGRFLGEDPSKTSVPRNVGRDLTQIGLVAPLGVPGGVGLTSVGEGMRPPWEQSPIQGPLRGLQMTSELAKLAFTQPEMLQKLGTSASLGLPSMISSAFREHPVLTPLMAVPILPGGKRFGADDANFLSKMTPMERKLWGKYSKDRFQAEKALENALKRIAARERRIKRKLTQHEVEDVIQQALSERPRTPSTNLVPALVPDPVHRVVLKTFTNDELLAQYQKTLAEVDRLAESYGGGRTGLVQYDLLRKLSWELRRRKLVAPPSQNAPNLILPVPRMWSEQKYAKWSDADIEERLLQLSTAPPLYKPIIDALRYEQARRAAGGRPYRTREELLHEFEEGPPGPLPPTNPTGNPLYDLSDEAVIQQFHASNRGTPTYDRYLKEMARRRLPIEISPVGPITSNELNYYATRGNFSRAEHSTQPFEPRVSGVHKLSNKDLLARFKELSSDTHDMLKSNVLPGGIHTFHNLEYLAELEKRGIVPKDSPITADLLRNILKARQGQEGAQPLPPGIFSSPEQIGGQMLRNELGPPSGLGLSKPVEETPPATFMDVLQTMMGHHLPWQQRVQQLLDNEWRRQPQTGPMAGPPDVRHGTNFLNTYAGSQPIGTKFSYKGQDFMRLRRGWSYIPRGEGPLTYGELSKQVTGGSDLLSQVPLPKQPQNTQQQIVAKLNAFGAGASQEWWEGGQRYIKGPKGWTMDPHMFVPPIQRKGKETILPRPEGALARYLKINVWDPFNERMGMPNAPQSTFLQGMSEHTGPQRFLQAAQEDLEMITGNPQIAQFWLKQHIFQRITERKATPSEVVWFELQRKIPGINPKGTATEPFRIPPARLKSIRGLSDYDLTKGYNEMARVKDSPRWSELSERDKADLNATMNAYAQEMSRRRKGGDGGLAGSPR